MIDHLDFNQDLRLIEARFSGRLEVADVQMYYSFLRCSVLGDEGYHELIDYTNAAGHSLGEEALGAASEGEFRRQWSRNQRCRTAYVVTDEALRLMAEDFIAWNDDLVRQAACFQTRDAALAWLHEVLVKR